MSRKSLFFTTFMMILVIVSVFVFASLKASAVENETIADTTEPVTTQPVSSEPVTTQPAPTQPAKPVSVDWVKVSGKWKYTLANGSCIKNGVHNINGKNYFFDNNGYLCTGVKKIGKKRFLFSSSGQSPATGYGARCEHKGFCKSGSRHYYINSDKTVQTGWKRISGKVYHFSKKGVMSLGFKKIGNKKFFFNKKASKRGRLVKGWKKIGKYTYYFRTKGKLGKVGRMQKNKIAGTKKNGRYFVDKKGRKIKTRAYKLAVDFVIKHTKKSWSKSRKLRTCFDYLWRNYTYKRVYGLPKSGDISKKFAGFILSKKHGNCFCYGAAFTCIARVIGYKHTRLCSGMIASSGGGMTPHGWSEVKIDGKWYIIDPDMQREIRGIGVYKRTRHNYPYRLRCNECFELNFRKAKLRWKRG